MQTNVNIQVPPADEALADVMMRIVSELHDVAYLIERIEPMLGEIEEEAAATSPDRVKLLQGIDLAVQKTRGLAEFIDTITASVPGDWHVNLATALNLVKLADMKHALATGRRHGHSQPLNKAAGDFDFF